jgi:hypothetical protein
MARLARLALSGVLVVAVVPFAAWFAWESWRAYTLRAFCGEVRPGISLADLYRLEERYRINDSYLMEARLPGYINQARSRELTFRSHPLDPDFDCDISHDGATVTAARLVE